HEETGLVPVSSFSRVALPLRPSIHYKVFSHLARGFRRRHPPGGHLCDRETFAAPGPRRETGLSLVIELKRRCAISSEPMDSASNSHHLWLVSGAFTPHT
ncbi:hypothetical protein ACOJI1_006110, partial [Pseudomonas aeruginosa]